MRRILLTCVVVSANKELNCCFRHPAFVPVVTRIESESHAFVMYQTFQWALWVILGASLGAVLLFIGIVVFWTRRNRRKPFDLSLEEASNESITVKSAPTSRTPSPKLPKRLSCPDAFQYPKQSLLIRSMTVDRVPDFTLPPERIQPRPSSERGGNVTALQYQQSLIGSLQPDLY
ncbi:hypothetical protein BaRGS_00037729, partial [Batillaria attramentaria]